VTVALTVFALLGFGLGQSAAAHRVGLNPTHAQGPVFEWILLDADTGQVLSEQNADVETYPASLTKMMTLYLTFEALNQGRIRLDQQFTVSADAAAKAPSKLGLTPGDTISVHDLILSVITKSANDAATVLAEGLAGSEAQFAQKMTWKARQLGMKNTWYHNASGLPDPQQRTTARDVARLALALYQHFPREYRYFSTTQFEFRGNMLHTHNHLLEWYQGLDGIKTGFINASGFNLAASAVRDGHRLLGVIMGGHTARGRDRQMASLLDQGFAALGTGHVPPAASEPLVASASAPATAVAAHAAPPVRAAVAVADDPKPTKAVARSSGLNKMARAALRHLAPVAKAEAAPISHESSPAESGKWAIQVGAFRGEAAAKRATRRVAGLAIVKGKRAEVVATSKRGKDRLYRARLVHFTSQSAHAACAALHRKKIACTVVPPSGVRMASD
jgi:D-alanyl-D-alanine carboxypeptidase